MLVQNVIWLHFIFIVLYLCRYLHGQNTIQKSNSNITFNNSSNELNADVRRGIVKYHNIFRSKVNPPASNMLQMSWSVEAAANAQIYAEKCYTELQENNVPYLGTCGQNTLETSELIPWRKVLQAYWYKQNEKFKYGDPNIKLADVCHYTQMIWATSHKVGCGFAKCAGETGALYYNYVCHYCPGLNNPAFAQYPYKSGQKCADCPGDCVHSLCSKSCSFVDVLDDCEAQVYDSNYACDDGMCNATCNCKPYTHKNFPW